MIAALLLATAVHPATLITRDPYGVPYIHAETVEQAWEADGYAVAQDRMWQMENSRRLARGKMAAAFGKAYVASDKEVLLLGYTDEELEKQYQALSKPARDAIDGYTRGVNQFLSEGKLPEGYAKAGLKPEPWSRLDSVAITIRLLQYFGRGGAGQIRNLAFYNYLQSQPAVKGRELDVVDDFLWFNEHSSPTTLLPEDEPRNHPVFSAPTREVTKKHLASMPKVNLFQLLPALKLAERETSTRVAQARNVPFKTGSYCVVVGSSLSANGQPLLLSGPQMGFTSPSIVHEVAMESPAGFLTGADVPGVPGVVVGKNSHIAWGLTTGVAGTDEVFWYPTKGESRYGYGSANKPIEVIRRKLAVKDQEDQEVVQKRTLDGPILLSTPDALFARKMSYWMEEMKTFDAMVALWASRDVVEVNRAVDHATLNFNFFYVARAKTPDGVYNGPMPPLQIGWRYLGKVPVRAEGYDPRFPAPGDPEHAWKGFIPINQMPQVINPKSGYIANWNNKPVSWWPNWDTPAWGEIFRNESLVNALFGHYRDPLRFSDLVKQRRHKLTIQDLETAAWSIARMDETWPSFRPWVSRSIPSFDGRLLDGSVDANRYLTGFDRLRESLFKPSIGGLVTPEFFRTVTQPSVVLRALQGKTKFDYLGRKKAQDLVSQAFNSVASDAYKAKGINLPGLTPIPYSNRGTYIQLIDFGTGNARNVLPPGVAEEGAHRFDQVDLARAWLFKPMQSPTPTSP